MKFIRDKRSPLPKNDTVSKVMSANRGRRTKPEQILAATLWRNGYRGYRLNYSKAQGRPDIAYVGKKTAIFVHGCYWHRCPNCKLKLPVHNSVFWKKKFEANVSRDLANTALLEEKGWTVIVVWECEIKRDLDNVMILRIQPKLI